MLAGFPVGPEIPAGIDGRVTTRQFVLKSYELTVQFVTPDGTLRNKNLELTTLFGGIAEEREPTVRLMPGSVDDFALSLAVDVAKTRWAAAAFFVVIGILLLGGACAGIVYAIARQSRRILRAARTGTPQACELISREPILYQGSPTGTDTFKFKVASAVAGAPPTEVKYQLRTKGSDVVQLASGKAVLALVPAGAPDKAILVLRDYYPLGFSDSERMQADAAVASGQR